MADPYKGKVIPLDGPVPYKGKVLPLDAPSGNIDEEIKDWSQYGKPRVEFPDAPTTGHIELPAARIPFLEDEKNAPDKLPFGSKFATLFGTLSTDNPRARQQIYAKHLPGAKAVDDKYGNPMIEYKGKKYYTSDPTSSVDAMDAGRFVAGVAGTVPAMAIAPVSVPLAMAAGGVLAAGQSVAEDAVTRASGGTAQQIDPLKAATAGVLGGLAPGVLASLGPIARRLYGAAAGDLFTSSGAPTTRGARILREAGITDDQIARMTPEMRQSITQAVNRNFGSADAVLPAQRQALGERFNVRQTTGEISGDAAQIETERALRGGDRGTRAQNIMREHTQDMRGDITAAQEMIRRQAGSGRVLTPSEAGEILGREQGAASAASRNQVTANYTRAFDGDEVVRAGGTPNVEIERIQGLPNAIEDWFMNPTRSGGMLIPTAENTPTTMQAINRLRQFSETGSIPSAFPRATDAATAARAARMPGEGPTIPTNVGWQQIDLMRKQLSRLQGSIPNTPERTTDRLAMRTVMQAFDEHLADRNPLLRQAIDSAAERFQTFRPDKLRQTPLTQDVLRVLSKPEPAQEGAEVFNKLFGGKLAKGEALGAIEHLTQIHPPGSPGHNVMTEQALRKIFVQQSGKQAGRTHTPQEMVTAIDAAFGPAQGDVYRRLLNPAQQQEVMRFRDLMDNIAQAQRDVNPSGSGHYAVREGRKLVEKATGGGIATWLARVVGLGKAGEMAAGAAGAVAGALTGGARNTMAARAAINPGAGATNLPIGRFSNPAGLLAAEPAEQAGAGQPIDRLWQGLLQP